MDTYGDIVLPEHNQSTLDSMKAAQAKLLALEISLNRSDEIDSDNEKLSIEYVAQWYKFDYERRTWVPNYPQEEG